eukprot:NODE_685_length_4747_cov_0.548623.p2 type:complete len:365 gc:universal NODE_685_length_4747_cov_0.548623:2759-3853(+)
MKIDKERYERAIRRAKMAVHPTRSKWSRLQYYLHNFEYLQLENIHRYSDLPLKHEFNYQNPSIMPLNWHKYTPYELLKRFAQQQSQIGDDDDGKAVYLRFKYFMHYCATDAIYEDCPLYMFDEHFRNKSSKTTKIGGDVQVEILNDNSNLLSDDAGIENWGRISKEYDVPHLFKHDFLDLVENRPPNKWIVVGPARSGTTMHQDPVGTAAWNMLLHGRKRWVLFPPETPKSQIEPFYVNEAAKWFKQIYPQINHKNKIEFIQHAGECVYIPSKWHHVVINLDFTIAITHNFCVFDNFDTVYRHCKWERPKMASKLKQKIENNEDLSELLEYYKINTNDLIEIMNIVDYMPQHELSEDPSSSDED